MTYSAATTEDDDVVIIDDTSEEIYVTIEKAAGVDQEDRLSLAEILASVMNQIRFWSEK